MLNSIENNKFYKTFTPFINEHTKTAEKTMNGKTYISKIEKRYKFKKEFYNYITAGGVLMIPALALAISHRNILRKLQLCNKEFFKVVNNEENMIFPTLGKNMALFKHKFYTVLGKIITPITTVKEKISTFLNKPENKLYTRIKNFFINAKTSAAQKQYKQVTKNFKMLEDNIAETLSVLADSEKGKIRISLPKELSKTADEFPVKINLNKTADGNNRSEEIKQILAEIKSLLSQKGSNFTNIASRITYSCEDVFAKGEATIISLCKKINNFGFTTKESNELIKQLYSTLTKYRFAEFSQDLPNATAPQLRQHYVEKMKTILNDLKTILPVKNQVISSHIKKLEELINVKANPNEMGLLEKLQMLLKCSDIKSENIKDGVSASILKQYRPENYIKTKQLIKKFANSIKFAKDIQGEIFSPERVDIESGGLITKGLSVILPASYLAYEAKAIKNDEKRLKEKRNLISFLCGAAVMLGTHYFTMTSKKVSILYGIISAFISSRLAEKYVLKEH